MRDGIIEPDGNGGYRPVDQERLFCSQQGNNEKYTKCCSVCQNYVKAVVKALAGVSDQDYRAYVPYLEIHIL